MKSDFLLAFNQICTDRGLPSDVVLEALEMALVSAYRRNLDDGDSQNVVAKIDMDSGQASILVEKTVVEDITDANREVSLADALRIDPSASVGESVMVDCTPDDFGRIAAQNAKQIILQRIREAEREARYEHYVEQEGEIVHGTVQNITPQAIEIHLEGTEAILPRSQQVHGERYSIHQRLRAYVLEVRKTSRGPQIIVSRSHKNMLRRLLELEVPEVYNGAVEIKSIAREAGSRSKVAVAARQAGVDPVGACVGMRGVRIQSIVNELGGEKIDVVEWSPDPEVFISNALSPAQVLAVQPGEDEASGKTASVVVPDDKLSLAIGRAGQNARLAAKLTGWRIDIQGVTEAATWAMQKVNEDPNVLPALGVIAELLPKLANILAQHEQEGLPYSGEELLAARQVIQGVQGYYASIRNAERARRMEEEEARLATIRAAEEERRAAIEAARATIPSQAYDVPIVEMGLSARVLGHLTRAGLNTAGDVMERLAEGDEGLLRLDGVGPKSLADVKQTLESLQLPEAQHEVEPEEQVAEEEGAPVERELEGLGAAEADQLEMGAEADATEQVPVAEVEAAVPEAAESMEETGDEREASAGPEVVEAGGEEPEPTVEAEISLKQPEQWDVVDDLELKSRKKESRARSRELVYDEELGMVVARRRRKRGGDEWDET